MRALFYLVIKHGSHKVVNQFLNIENFIDDLNYLFPFKTCLDPLLQQLINACDARYIGF